MLPFFTISILLVANKALADPTDFLDPRYAISHAKDFSTTSSQQKITQNARSAARDGPWTVVNDNGATSPSGDKRDYLSWAPYHWPDCNWCSSGRTHLAHSGDGGNDTDSGPDDSSNVGPGDQTGDDSDYTKRSLLEHDRLSLAARHNRILRLRRTTQDLVEEESSSSATTSFPSAPTASVLEDVPLPQVPFGTTLSSIPTGSLPTPVSHTTRNRIAGSSTAPQAAEKTHSCRPSPTKSLAPSATWTTCPYVARDGQVNPDTRSLVGPGAANKMSDGVISNVLATLFTGSSQYTQNAINLLQTFFLNPSTSMNTNMNYGQVVRGPDNNVGTFTGPLDLRGFIKVINSVLILRQLNIPNWTPALDQGMQNWFDRYITWFETDQIGKKAISRPNNHGTFACALRMAGHIMQSENQKAIEIALEFYNNAFKEQIAANGEQPYEAVRTRPFHYRAFNIEAMIVVAKLCDYLGLDAWSWKSKYGGTIQKAVEYAMAQDPGKENVQDLIPHVMAIAAAYGSSPKYIDYLDRYGKGYQSTTSYYYDQPSALSNAPTSKRKKRSSVVWEREDGATSAVPSTSGPLNPDCPPIFGKESNKVELDNGVFCSCQEILPLLEQPVDQI